jgi:serine/threonine protein kinase
MAALMDPPLSFSGELWFRRPLLQDSKVYLLLDTVTCVFKHFKNRDEYMDDGIPEFQFELSELVSIRDTSNQERDMFTIKTRTTSLTYYADFRDMTSEWFKKFQLSLDYYHISFADRKRQEEDKLSNNSEYSEDTTTNGENFVSEESFEVLQDLGQGGFGSVTKVSKKDTGEIFALKRLNKASLRSKGMIKYAISECKTLKSINHPFIINLEWSFHTKNHICLVLEFCPFGDFEPVLDHFKKLEEQVAKFYICETILAFEYLHSRNIIYRDLKPSNLLLDKEGHIKLSDFSLAKENVTVENPAISFCGTLAYLPPETLNNTGAYTATDVYLIGVNLFLFLTGKTPFYDKINSFQDFSKAISTAKLAFPPDVKKEARDLISAMMNRNPEKRPSIKSVKEHRFFKDVNWDLMYQKTVPPPIPVEVLASIVSADCEYDTDLGFV